MATYKKVLKTLEIKTLNSTTVTVADTAEKALASNVLAEFQAGQTLHVKTSEGETDIPFHAIDSVKITTAQSDEIDKADPYGCEVEETPEP